MYIDRSGRNVETNVIYWCDAVKVLMANVQTSIKYKVNGCGTVRAIIAIGAPEVDIDSAVSVIDHATKEPRYLLRASKGLTNGVGGLASATEKKVQGVDLAEVFGRTTLKSQLNRTSTKGGGHKTIYSNLAPRHVTYIRTYLT